ncbi:MAG: cytochrome P460 family protein [Pseudomonadota bacterium]
MKAKTLPSRAVALAIVSVMFSAGAAAACDVDKAGFDLTLEEAQSVYECIEDSLNAGYQGGNLNWIPEDFVRDYKSWKLASTAPAAPGFHSNRFLLTYVNDVGFEAYTKYEEDPVIPAGTVIAKESFGVNDEGKVRPGPLFIMQKAEPGASPETLDWYYMAVSTGGNAMAINVMTACNDCHIGFDYQGGMGYPVEEARLPN